MLTDDLGYARTGRQSGGGKGPLISEKSFTLSTSNFQIVFLFEATRVDDTRIYENYSPTVARYWGTGGARVPYVYAIQGSMINRQDHNGPGGKGYTEETPMYTLENVSVHAVAQVFEPKSAFEENWAESEVKNALRANASKSSHAVVGSLQARDYKGLNHEGARDGKAIVTNSVVRRLTPIECERLQGFPDNWTEGQSDSHRYKQMGNAVAVPVVSWIIANITRPEIH